MSAIDVRKELGHLIWTLYGMVWYGMVWYGMVWYGMVWYVIWYDMIRYGIVYVMVLTKVGFHDRRVKFLQISRRKISIEQSVIVYSMLV
jgi:hypothetical protein